LGSDTTSPVRTATSTPSSASWGDEGSLNPLGEASAFNASNAYGNFSTPYPSSGPQPGDPLRYQETVLRVWVAPYEDKEGNYYQPTTLYTVVKPGHWVGNPPKAVSDDREE
jgi:type IV conjugative transfer system lipoprotein TraV